MRFSGSKACLKRRKASIMVGPNMRSSIGLRARPSPCSLEMVPWNSSTRSAISSEIARTCSRPRDVLRLMAGRMCRQPTEQWP
jgi:hypothetical protein